MKCFLSHSSADKSHYVAIVANKLGSAVEYDEKTFEEGMGNFEEILNGMQRSQVFVLFISDNSLNSEWVAKEIGQAKSMLDNGQLKRFYPLLIDKKISFKDPRIPDWIRDNYNLRPITKPTVAAKRIRERMIEASWNSHPMLKDRNRIFVGRNTIIGSFEERIDDFDKDQPLVVFASGLRDIGRKSTLLHSLRKSNIVRETYEPIRIDLAQEDGLEGLILKLADLDYSDDVDVSNLLERGEADKIELCAKLFTEIFRLDEVILIDDQHSIVRFDRAIAPWFLKVCGSLKSDKLQLCIATAVKAARYLYVTDDRFFFMEIPELQKTEREGLFRRHAELLGLELSKNDLKKFSGLLVGFPEQVTYAAALVESLGVSGALERSPDILAYSTFKANLYIRKYEDEAIKISFLRFLASFEFVSLDFVHQIDLRIGHKLPKILDEFVSDSVCEPIGRSGQYFRVNEVIRDAIVRDSLQLNDDYREALKNFAMKFCNDYSVEQYDVSEYQIAIKEALMSNIYIPESLLIPAHFLQTMKELYGEGSYSQVVALADRILLKADNYDQHTSHDIRYFLCQSLARMKNSRFTSEVQKIIGAEHNYLFGFYYRLQGRFPEALLRYQKAMKEPRTEQRSRREIVFLLTTIEDYEGAYSLAKENYERYPSNPYLVQAYFECLLHINKNIPDREEALRRVLRAFDRIHSSRAYEMRDTLSARLEYKFGDKAKAFDKIDDAISTYSNVPYPQLAKLDMAVDAADRKRLLEAVRILKSGSGNKTHAIAISKAEVMLCAIEGDGAKAERLIEKDLKQLSDAACERLRRKVKSYIVSK